MQCAQLQNACILCLWVSVSVLVGERKSNSTRVYLIKTFVVGVIPNLTACKFYSGATWMAFLGFLSNATWNGTVTQEQVTRRALHWMWICRQVWEWIWKFNYVQRREGGEATTTTRHPHLRWRKMIWKTIFKRGAHSIWNKMKRKWPSYAGDYEMTCCSWWDKARSVSSLDWIKM